MQSFSYVLSNAVVRALGWTLVHSLWQGVLVAFMAAVLLQLLRNHSAALRYRVAYIALMSVLLAAVINFERLYSAEKRLDTEGTLMVSKTTNDSESIVIQILGNQSIVENWLHSASDFLNQHLTAIAVAWCIGFFFFGLKLTFGWWILRGHQKRGGVPLAEHWQTVLRHFQRQLSISKRSVRLLEAAWVLMPLTVGWLRPAIFLPIGIVNRLSPTEVEAILAHELAHIADHDYVFNFLQAIVEVIFYYHPVVWWLSSVIRNEREMRCDDVAIALCGNNRLAYAKTLVRLQEQLDDSTTRVPQLALAFGKRQSFLFYRVQRLFISPNSLNKQSEIMHKLMITGLLLTVTLLFSFAKNRLALTRDEATADTVFPKTEQSVLAKAETTMPKRDSSPTANLKIVGTKSDTSAKPRPYEPMRDTLKFSINDAGIVKMAKDTTFTPPNMTTPDVPPNPKPGWCYSKCKNADGTYAEWLQIVCQESITPEFVKDLTDKLKADGSLATSIETEEITKPVRDAVVAYQVKHHLPCGNLNAPTMTKLGIKIVTLKAKKAE